VTNQELITRALRSLRVLAAGEDPAAAESTDCMSVLQGFYVNLVTSGMFGPLTSVLVAEDYEAGENELISYDGATTVEITLPTTVEDAITGDDRAPKDRAVVVVAGDEGQTWLYDRPYGAWVRLDALTLEGDAPLSSRYEQALIAMFAVQVAPEFGAEPSAILVDTARRGRANIRRRDPFTPNIDATFSRLSARRGC
jgi:hypothetical protein